MADAMKLLPCPFCGDDDPEITGENGWVWIACTTGSDCAGRGPDSDDEASAIEAWNRRASPPPREEAPDEGAGDGTTPPPHWTDADQYDRHPKAADDWNWRNDPPLSEGGLDLAVRRLNFAGDRADPRAPDQMALVLRKDLINIKHELISQTALAALRNRTSEPEAGAVAWLTPGGDVTRSHAYAVEQSANDPDHYPQALYLHPAPATADKLKVAKGALEKIRDGYDAKYTARQALAALNEGGE